LKERQVGGTWTAFNQWYPTHKDQAEVGFSLYLGTTTHIADHFRNNALDLRVWPNPAQDRAQLSFETSQVGEAQLTLYNLTGQAVLSHQLATQPGENQTVISLQGLPNGMYWLQVQAGSDFGIRPLTIQR
jgi:hypothetical protein